MIDRSFQGVNRPFSFFENKTDTGLQTGFYIPKVEITYYNVVIDGRNFFDQPRKNGQITYDNIRKIAADQGDDYTTRCLLDYPYFTKYHKLIAIDLSKPQKLDADPKAVQ